MPQIYWTASVYKQLIISVTPHIGMLAENVVNSAAFTVELAAPQFVMGIPSRSASVGISVAPRIGMAAVGTSEAAFTVAVTPSIAMAAQGVGTDDLPATLPFDLGGKN